MLFPFPVFPAEGIFFCLTAMEGKRTDENPERKRGSEAHGHAIRNGFSASSSVGGAWDGRPPLFARNGRRKTAGGSPGFCGRSRCRPFKDPFWKTSRGLGRSSSGARFREAGTSCRCLAIRLPCGPSTGRFAALRPFFSKPFFPVLPIRSRTRKNDSIVEKSRQTNYTKNRESK